MLSPRLFLLLVLPLGLGATACSRKAGEDPARARTDLEQVCRAQRSYLETRRLMKSVKVGDLDRERQAHFTADVKTTLVQSALRDAARAPAGQRRKPLDLAAAQAGLRDWNCPELDQL